MADSAAQWVSLISSPDIYSGSIEIGRMPKLVFGEGFKVVSDPLNSRNIVTVTVTGSVGPPGSGSFTAGGDLAGTNTSQTVQAIRGKSLPASFASPGDLTIPMYFASPGTYLPTQISLTGSMTTGVLPKTRQQPQDLTGDVIGTTDANEVSLLQGHNLFVPSPASGSQLNYNGSQWQAEPQGTGGSSVTWANDLATSDSTSQNVVSLSGQFIGMPTQRIVEVPSASIRFAGPNVSGAAISGSIQFDSLYDNAGHYLVNSRGGDGTSNLPIISVSTQNYLCIGDPEQKAGLLKLFGVGQIVANTTADGNFAVVGSTTTFFSASTGAIDKLDSVVTVDGTPATLLNKSLANNSVQDFSFTIIGRDTSNNGDTYRANVFGTFFVTGSGDPIQVGTVDITAVKTFGAGSGWSVSLASDGGQVVFAVTGSSGHNVNWTAFSENLVAV